MEGHDYTFRVSAENELGVGEPCQTDVPTRAKGAIGAYARTVSLATGRLWVLSLVTGSVCVVELTWFSVP